jgi:ABC-type phosphate transport system substrate-binding protein
LAIVVGDGVRVRSITIHQLSDVITGKIKNWKILGGPNQAIILAGREPTEAAFTVLKKDYPFFNKAQFNHVFTRDHQIMKIISSSGGKYTLSFGARNNFDEKNILHVEGFKSGVKAGLVYDIKNKNHPLVYEVKKYAGGRDWRRILTENGFYPIHQ